jgi:hypothetical protein
MKKIIQFCLAAVVLVAFAACEHQQEVDPRDAFVGTYSYDAKGSVNFDFGITTYSVPLNKQGTFTISKVGDGNKVVIEGWNDPINATVSGNQLTLESNTYDTMYGEIALQLSFSYGTAILVDNRLSWNTDVSGEGRYGSYTAIGTGTVSMNATKQ